MLWGLLEFSGWMYAIGFVFLAWAWSEDLL